MNRDQTNESNKDNVLSNEGSLNKTNKNKLTNESDAIKNKNQTVSSFISKRKKINSKTVTIEYLKQCHDELNALIKKKEKEDRIKEHELIEKQKQTKRIPFIKDLELCMKTLTSNDLIDCAIQSGVTSEHIEIAILNSIANISPDMKNEIISQYKPRKSKKSVFQEINKTGI